MASTGIRPSLQVDVVSDVTCPWYVAGIRQLDAAFKTENLLAGLLHLSESNPAMGSDGQNLREHIAEKYGSSPEQSRHTRDRLSVLGAELGFAF